ncbi:SDR family oxidoreductase [Cupriavidus sp. CV2]|uniref:SDR family NAD(P)-dependent oxidoreductase n=1 Tax=Cupriavidus ulmosensis TaxID=3065913 RepID=UPI00296A985D|nr:SDR family oxidoreductase [Cupriavidus sp. CV2]MDW3685511.1 SDR family oxidoreductase [Cupriavidus sp. CV2]
MTESLESRPDQQLFAPALGLPRREGRLAGRRILVVGAGQRRTVDPVPSVGNGRAMSLLFAREGAAVACADIDLTAAQDTVDRIRHEGGVAVSVQADVADPAQIARMVAQAEAALGGLDGLVVNVGIGNQNRFGAETPDDWGRVQDINLRAPMFCAQEAAAVMPAGSTIVFVASTAAISPLSGLPAYETSKAALMALGRAVAFAGQPSGLRANVLAPGLIDTPMGRDASRARPSRATRPLPFGRQGTGWEVAHAALYLISTESSYVNGQMLIVDGGLSIGAVRAAG